MVDRRQYGRGCFRRKVFQQLRGWSVGAANAIKLLQDVCVGSDLLCRWCNSYISLLVRYSTRLRKFPGTRGSASTIYLLVNLTYFEEEASLISVHLLNIYQYTTMRAIRPQPIYTCRPCLLRLLFPQLQTRSFANSPMSRKNGIVASLLPPWITSPKLKLILQVPFQISLLPPQLNLIPSLPPSVPTSSSQPTSQMFNATWFIAAEIISYSQQTSPLLLVLEMKLCKWSHYLVSMMSLLPAPVLQKCSIWWKRSQTGIICRTFWLVWRPHEGS